MNACRSSIFFNDTATDEVYTLSLHDALPIYIAVLDGVEHLLPHGAVVLDECVAQRVGELVGVAAEPQAGDPGQDCAGEDRKSTRLNSSHANISYAVLCLKKNIKMHNPKLSAL